MAKAPRISEAEWVVMEVLWAGGPQTASQVVETLSGQSDWSAATIKTLLNRLTRKGAIKFRAEGKRYIYRPAVSRQVCARGEARGLARRLFQGRFGPLLAHFVEDAKLSPAEIEHLRQLLAKKGG